MTIQDAASEFLTKKRVAVTGVSRKPQTHAANDPHRSLDADADFKDEPAPAPQPQEPPPPPP